MSDGSTFSNGCVLGAVLGVLITVISLAIGRHGEVHRERDLRDQVYNEAVRRGFGEYNNGSFVWEKAYDPRRPTIGTKDVITPEMLEKAAQ